MGCLFPRLLQNWEIGNRTRVSLNATKLFVLTRIQPFFLLKHSHDYKLLIHFQNSEKVDPAVVVFFFTSFFFAFREGQILPIIYADVTTVPIL